MQFSLEASYPLLYKFLTTQNLQKLHLAVFNYGKPMVKFGWKQVNSYNPIVEFNFSLAPN